MNRIAKRPSFHIILLLILAGESVFILPFVLARIFRPTFLEVFGLDNFELGTCFSIYGIVALISYLFGGVLADRFQPRILMGVSLFLTALGGAYMATFPSYSGMRILYGYWGFTTIFLFWAAMIKATRSWGGETQQGKAFGFLDGGRGLVSAGIGSLGVLVFTLFLAEQIDVASIENRRDAFRTVVILSSIFAAFVGLMVLIWLRPKQNAQQTPQRERITLDQVQQVLKLPSVWLLMFIILCGYTGYKSTDFFSQYAKDVMKYDEVKSATIGSVLLYLRPVVGISFGLLADRTRPTLWLIVGFTLMLTGSALFGSGIIPPHISLFFISMFSMAIGVYACRSLYFAVMKEGRIPLALTGTAVGIVSFVGYTPDIFMGPITGILLDENPGATGHEYVFTMLAAFSVLGLAATLLFKRLAERPSTN